MLAAQRWVLAALRHRRFFTLAELDAAMPELVAQLNARPMKKLGVSRQDLVERVDRPALRPGRALRTLDAIRGSLRT